jgi:hypothetical protein
MFGLEMDFYLRHSDEMGCLWREILHDGEDAQAVMMGGGGG